MRPPRVSFSLTGSACCTVAKLGPTGRAIIITVYVEG